MDTIAQLLVLMQPCVDSGRLLERSAEKLQANFGDFVMINRDGVIVGCAGLKHYPKQRIGEIYALVVNPHYHNIGVSSELLSLLFDKARELRLESVFAVSKYGNSFFIRNGFEIIDVESLPVERQATYDYQRRSNIYKKYC